MFKVSKSGYSAISATRKSEKPVQSKSTLGTNSRALDRREDAEWTSQSNVAMQMPGTPNGSVAGNAVTIDIDPMLLGMTPQNEKALYPVYKDIYYNESVAGCAVDLISSLPFSEFSLGGLATQRGDLRRVHHEYEEVLERLNLRTLLPEMSVDYLVMGKHCSSLLYNRERKTFTDILPHPVESLTITPLPFYSQDPIINVAFQKAVTDIMGRTDSPRIKRIREHLGPSVCDAIAKGSMELDPLSTIFIPRRTFSANDTGTSYLRRILPIYLIEKNLFRGTLVESARRQRGIMHVTLGDGDQWIPSVQDMEFITELFQGADSDPLGAIIATRMGVSVEEIRQGGDFWKSTDFNDSVLSHKLRALGISEAFLSGDANYSTGDAALSVFLDTIRTFRDMMTRKLFYNKLFPLISLINGFTTKNGKLTIQDNLISQVTSEEALQQLNDNSKLFIPSVHWNKQLKPEGDTAYMEMLSGMAEKGIPVPLRMLAAAGGLDIDTLIRQQDEDIDMRKRVAEYVKRITELTPKTAMTESESADRVMAANRLAALAASDPTGKTRSSVLAERGRVPILSRDYSSYEPYDTTKTGKKKVIHNRAAYERRANENIVRALRNRRNK